MEMSSNLHAPAALPAGEKPSVTAEKKAEGSGEKFRLEAVEKMQIPCFSRESNRGPSVLHPVD
jgi:hypothetical protein